VSCAGQVRRRHAPFSPGGRPRRRVRRLPHAGDALHGRRSASRPQSSRAPARSVGDTRRAQRVHELPRGSQARLGHGEGAGLVRTQRRRVSAVRGGVPRCREGRTRRHRAADGVDPRPIRARHRAGLGAGANAGRSRPLAGRRRRAEAGGRRSRSARAPRGRRCWRRSGRRRSARMRGRLTSARPRSSSMPSARTRIGRNPGPISGPFSRRGDGSPTPRRNFARRSCSSERSCRRT
jgi:hypothetical protein